MKVYISKYIPYEATHIKKHIFDDMEVRSTMRKEKRKSLVAYTIAALSIVSIITTLFSFKPSGKTLYEIQVEVRMPDITSQTFKKTVRVYENNYFDAKRAAQSMVEDRISVEVKNVKELKK